MTFRLPPEIIVSKMQISTGLALVFRHRELGELGRILVQGIGGGQSQISCEVVGEPDDPMTAKRRAIFEPLAIEISNSMGPGVSVPYPQPLQEPSHMVPSRLLQCNHCESLVTMLILAKGSTPDKLEDYARLMYAKAKELNLPTWVIGCPLGDGNDAPAYILKIWPLREPIRCLRPSEFNPELNRLQEDHCAKKRSGLKNKAEKSN